MEKNKTTSKVFNIYKKFKVKFVGPETLIQRIADNVEGEDQSVKDADALIKINTGKEYERIKKDKRFPYQRVSVDNTKKTIDYFRYNTFVRRIYKTSQNTFNVDINIENDEAAGLICLRNYSNNHKKMHNLPLVHASLVDMRNQGILIAGQTRSGKTTLMLYIMQYLGADIVSEDNVYLEQKHTGLTGLYFPKVPRIRFNAAHNSCLSKFLYNLEDTNATQYWDIESIEEVVRCKNFEIDGGIAVSKENIAIACGVNRKETAKINKVIFTEYSSAGLNFRKLDYLDGFKLLESTGTEKKTFFDPRPLKQIGIDLSDYYDSKIQFYSLKFSGFKELEKERFEI